MTGFNICTAYILLYVAMVTEFKHVMQNLRKRNSLYVNIINKKQPELRSYK
jgi:hypothetical protein